MDFSETNGVCRLCLKKLTKNCEPLEEIVQHTLNFLTLYPNLTISDDPMMCETCAVDIKKCFDFKTRCLDTEDCIASFAESKDKKVELQDVYAKIKLDGNIAKVPYNYSVCRFCLELVKDDVSKSVRHDVDAMAILQTYFLEIDLRITDGIIACTPCYNSFQFHASFVNNHLSIEEKINEYCKIEGVNYKGQVDLRNVAAFTSKGRLNDGNISNIIMKDDKRENIEDTKVDIEIKFEELRDVKQENEELVHEELQQNHNKSFQHHRSPLQSNCEPQLPKAKPRYACDMYGYQNNRKDHLQEHLLAHKDGNLLARYNCELCSYKTTTKDNLRKHNRNTHRNKGAMYKCDLCNYEAKWKFLVKRHMISHKTPLEITMYKCDLCNYEAKYKYDLKRHMLIHKPPSEITMYKCHVCNYETKWKQYLKEHVLAHQTLYKCDQCEYKARYKDIFKAHVLTHKPLSETTMYKCETCAYESIHKRYLRKHAVVHLDVSEIEMHKCELCPYKTKLKKYLRQHQRLTHRNIPNVRMPAATYKCHLCDYETVRKNNLISHTLKHKTGSEATLYKCEVCAMETKYKAYLQRHMLKHKNGPEIEMHKS